MQHIFDISRRTKSLGGLLEAGCGFLPETCKMHKYRNKTDKQGNVENKNLTLGGGALANIPVAFFFSASRAAVLFLEAPPSVFFSLPPSAALEVVLFRFRANGASSLDTTVTSFIFGS